MNIKRAKEEIEHTVKAYLAKDALGEYAIPAIRQRPILLMGPPGIGKTHIGRTNCCDDLHVLGAIQTVRATRFLTSRPYCLLSIFSQCLNFFSSESRTF